ncbi:MAG TPA: hypothetical protein VFP83_07390 [Candidatus Limnocylindria bacterium]|nr:hypothetical protein [Candidatus Limnocylindria bacterium]
MRRFTTSLLAGLVLVIALAGSALGHVHGVTPLPCNANDNAATSGGNRTNTTPAAAANGGPISGVIPFGTGNAEAGNLDSGEGGRNSALCD